jgi:hypothetical protein
MIKFITAIQFLDQFSTLIKRYFQAVHIIF